MYKDEVEEIQMLNESRQYIPCLQKCFALLKKVDLNNAFEYSVIFNCYYKISTIYSRLNRFESAIQYAKKAKIFVDSTTNRIFLNWSLSFYYYKINSEKAIRYINYVINDCCKIEFERYVYEARIHLALLTNDVEMMNDAVENLEILGIDSNRMDEVYEDQFVLYVKINDMHNADIALHKIKNTNHRNELSNKIYLLQVM